MKNNDHYVIIGNGPAGNKAADTIRKNDKESRVTIISDEAFCFYYRHKLPAFISGDATEESLIVRPYSIYKENNIRMRLGQRVERIDPYEKTLYLKHMENVHYTKLILATGGVPNIISSLVNVRDYLTCITTYTDAIKAFPKIQAAKNILILGGDLTSLSFINQMVKMGKKVTLCLCQYCFWPVELTTEVVDKVCENLQLKNVETLLDDLVAAVAPNGNTLDVTTESGKAYNIDLLCNFMGLKPNIDFVKGSGINLERGILVDANLRTNFEDIYACGDCAQIFSKELKDYWISIGWNNAELQGEVAALNVLGQQKEAKPSPKNIFNMEGIKINTSWWKEF